ncbi:MAG: Peptidoglycan-N-acetylglucosamine deacetylase [Chroococcopsis gigantea SAG 12.99]|jgi:peptidoglycan/xylan/chitin deacetylase (PgdA/CDA1 family)|nr:polysaccharide deacetylase family protein [Chlorogloea purpurea SAG 13.99]MDV2999936.1 Peptidoglycan-N-acetylglucosamine deacetylase [Chroococcopsis gigantea SAG 12.99]
MLLQPQQLLTRIAGVFPDAIFYHHTREKIIALTIDDVGDPSSHLILDVIDRHNQAIDNPGEKVSATFFVIANYLRGDKTLLKRMIEGGHEIGNHGLEDRTHAHLSARSFEAEIKAAHEELCLDGEKPINWFRPGRGRYNAPMKNILAAMGKSHGYQPYFALGSMLPLDTFELTHGPVFTLPYVANFVFPGSILVLHGGSKIRSQNTAAVLKTILPDLRQQGYRVVSLSDLVSL